MSIGITPADWNLDITESGHMYADILCGCGLRATEYGQECRGIEIWETVTCDSCGKIAAERQLT